MRRRKKTRPAVRRSPSWQRSRTGRSHPSVVPRSRRESRRRRSLPTGLPSSSRLSRSRGAPRPRSRRRRLCERASTRNGVRAACRGRVASSWSAPPQPLRSSSPSGWPYWHRAPPASASTPHSQGPALAPGAKGEATLTKTSSGWRIELDADGLPRLDGGRFYEAWLKQSRRRARSRRDVQRGPEGDAMGGRVAERLHDADRHPRAGRRRSGLVGREGARRAGQARRLANQSEPPSIRRTTCWRARYRRLITVPSRIRRAWAASL